MTNQCMGAFACPKRANCWHYHAPQKGGQEPSENLCRGSTWFAQFEPLPLRERREAGTWESPGAAQILSKATPFDGLMPV